MSTAAAVMKPAIAQSAWAATAAATKPTTLHRGMTGDQVQGWQRKLVALGFLRRTDYRTGPGVFGPATEAATRKFQRRYHLDESGIAGPKTQAMMKRAYAPVHAYNHTTLERGAKSGAVMVWQRYLLKLGYLTRAQVNAGPREFRKVTEEATKRFQRDHQCVVSGRVGSNTRKQMARALSALEVPKPKPVVKDEVPYINQLTSDGWEDNWNAQSNCGPTTMAMIAKAFGFGRQWGDGYLVNWLGGKAGVGAQGVGWDGVKTMASAAGLSSTHRAGNDTQWILAELQAGRLVAANGDRSVCMQNGGNPDTWGYGGGGHWIAVVGFANGKFKVLDPSSDCRELTPSELKRFFDTRVPDGGHMVSIGK